VVTTTSNHQTHFPNVWSNSLTWSSSTTKEWVVLSVDLMDRLLCSYRLRILGKKWYWPLFLNALNISVVAGWRIHTKFTDNNLSRLEFRNKVSLCLLKSVPSSTSFKRPRMSSFPDNVRFNGFEHNKVRYTQGRCIVCKKKYYVSMCQMLGTPSLW